MDLTSKLGEIYNIEHNKGSKIYGKCSKITNTKKLFFSFVRNFRNYVCEKMLVFEILECGLYHEKNGIYACQNVVETY